jgi:alpha-ribazole phosphatase CobZ
MTAANVRNFVFTKQRSRKLTVATLVTAGLSFPAAAGDKPPSLRAEGGTINMILLIDGNPTESCMVDMVKTATEAKAVALRNLDIRSRFSKEVCTGTTTDGIVVASTGRSGPIEYAGTATTAGYLIARSVITGVEEAIAKEERIIRARPLLQRLGERGILLDDLVNTGIELFIRSSAMSVRKASALLRAELERALSDINVQALFLAAVRLEEDGSRGLIPGLGPEDFRYDPVTLVADESIGLAIANYLAGTWGTYNFLRYDRMKPGVMSRTGPFMDDAIGGLVAGALTRIMTRK